VLLARLQDLGNEHFGVRLEDIGWGDLDTVDHVAAKLREVVTLLCGEDDDAEVEGAGPQLRS
jgi:hypothetical protein